MADNDPDFSPFETVRTVDGAAYQFDEDLVAVRRVEGKPMQYDGDWLALKNDPVIQVGAGLFLIVETLAAPWHAFVRHTSPVESVEYAEASA